MNVTTKFVDTWENRVLLNPIYFYCKIFFFQRKRMSKIIYSKYFKENNDYFYTEKRNFNNYKIKIMTQPI